MPRPMTLWEKQRYGAKYPNLDVDQVVVTGEVSGEYNCISWTVGVTSRWIWPGYSKAAFDGLYGQYGVRPAQVGGIALWETLPSDPRPHPRMTHGCIASDTARHIWESKCGGLLRITHGLTELYGEQYGRPFAFYHSVHTKKLATFDNEKTPRPLPALTAEETARLVQKLGSLPESVKTEFENAFAAWQATWMAADVAWSSDPADRAAGPEFERLLAMGDVILPLVAAKMEAPDNFFALQLFERILGHAGMEKSFIRLPNPQEPEILEGEQGRARAALSGWLDLG
jgi:hypothetical protein